MNELLKEKEIKDLTDDYEKCDYYLINLKNGNVNCLNDAIDFSNKKYAEFCIQLTKSNDKFQQLIQFKLIFACPESGKKSPRAAVCP